MTPGNPTVEEVAARLRCSVPTVFRLLKRGVLRRAPRAGRATTVLLASVEAFEAGPPVPATPANPRRSGSPPGRFNAAAELALFRKLSGVGDSH
jgi:excisionase family DNA binding protein